MKHQVINKPGILYIKLEGEVSGNEFDALAEQVNSVPTQDCCRILIDAAEFTVTDSSDATRFREKVQLNDCRAAVVNGLHKLKTYRKRILEMFAGDYEVAFFDDEEEAVAWLKDLREEDCN